MATCLPINAATVRHFRCKQSLDSYVIERGFFCGIFVSSTVALRKEMDKSTVAHEDFSVEKEIAWKSKYCTLELRDTRN